MEWLSLEVVCLLAVLKTHTSCVAAMLTAKAPKTVLMNVGEGLGINKRGMIGVERCGVSRHGKINLKKSWKSLPGKTKKSSNTFYSFVFNNWC